MDFTQLPAEIFIQIAEFLDVNDLLSCSLVNSYWRSAVNSDALWKQHFQKHCEHWQDLTKCLETDQPLASPPVTLGTCETLEEICKWRIYYIKKMKLLNNWKNGKFKEEHIQVKDYNCTNMENEGDLLALNLNIGKKIELWSTKGFPKLLGEIPFSLQHIMCFECFKLVKSHLVFVQCNLLQIYFIDQVTCEINLKFRKLFNKSEIHSNNIPNSVDITDWYISNIGLYPSDSRYRCETASDFFIGMILEKDLKKTCFHIWNIISGKKLKEENIPMVPHLILDDIHFGTNSENIFLMLTCRSSLNDWSLIYTYNIKCTCYTNFVIKLDFEVPLILFTDIFIVYSNRTGDTINVWNFKSCSYMGKVNENDCMIKHSSMQVHNTLLIYATQFLLERIKVINLNTLQVLSSFQPYNTFMGLYDILFVSPKFVFIIKNNDTVYDIKNTSQPLYTLKCKTICANEIGTKLFAEKLIDDKHVLCILNFW